MNVYRAKVSMKEIAAAAGVSLMTVSRSLKNNLLISKATRERVQKIARELNYHPHPYISALMTNLSQLRKKTGSAKLAVFHFDSLKNTIGHNYYEGACARAASLGFITEPFQYSPAHMSSKRLRNILLAQGILGIVIMPAPDGFTKIDFDFNGFAAVALGHTVTSPPLPRVAVDNYDAVFQGLNRLIQRGYERIGLLTSQYEDRIGNYYYSAALHAYQSNVAKKIHLSLRTTNDPINTPSHRGGLKRWIKREKLQAVFSTNFYYYTVLQEEGFSIPEQLAYIVFSQAIHQPHLSTVYLPGELVGSKAVDLVTAAINRYEFQPQEYSEMVSVPCKWHEGTTAPNRLLDK